MSDPVYPQPGSNSLFDSSFPPSGQQPGIPTNLPPSSTSEPQQPIDAEPGVLSSMAETEIDENSNITIRALVTSKEAGVIIGKGGKNVTEMREETLVKAGVSKPVPGIPDRVLTIVGTLRGVARAYSLAAASLVESPPPPAPFVYALSPPPPPGIATIRLLISHQQMGTIIGRQGQKIRSIQENSRVRMVASKEMLPQSTERIVEIQGMPPAVEDAVFEVGKCLLADWERSAGTIPYSPQSPGDSLGIGLGGGGGSGGGLRSVSVPARFLPPHQPQPASASSSSSSFERPRYLHASASSSNLSLHHASESSVNPTPPEDELVQELSVPSDMVGCVIGRAGAKIQEIRKISGARISIARHAHDDSGNRLFTIRGSAQANQRAIDLLYGQLEQEKFRRSMDEVE